MKINPKNLPTLLKQSSSGLVARSRALFSRLDPAAAQDASDLNTYDESVLQQGRFWMRTVTWSLIGTTVFGVAWLALARTEEIVVAAGQLEPVGSVQDIQMPVGGVVQQILVQEGQSVTAATSQLGDHDQAQAGAARAEGSGKASLSPGEQRGGSNAREQSRAADRDQGPL